ncbi:MAG: hypothetical protein D3910_11745, partial [Candidatus Electrothrix sp. ATG2]|nr:hypothetical protein [Candidatus Electrothrix sp. ATG2]
MKVSLVVSLVSLPFVAACAPAVHDADLLENVNREEGAVRFVAAEKKGEEPEAVKLEKVSVPPQSTGRIAEKNMGDTEDGYSLAAVVYSSELVPIVEGENIQRAEKVKEESLASFPSLKYRKSDGPVKRRKRTNRSRQLSALRGVLSTDWTFYEINKRSSEETIPVAVGSTGRVKKERENVPPFYSPVQSEQELKEELTALEKTGDWSDSGEGKHERLSSYGIQCDLPKSFVPARIKLDIDFLTAVAKGKKDSGEAEQQEQEQ